MTKPLNKFLFVVFILFSFEAFNQGNDSYSIRFNVLKIDNKLALGVDGFSSSTERLPLFSEKIKLPRKSTIAPNIEIESSEPLSDYELSALNSSLKSKIPTIVELTVFYSKERKVDYAIVSFSPLYKKGSKIYKISKFKLTYTSQAVSTAESSERSGSRSFKSASILSSGSIYKLAVNTNGIYKLTYKFLESNGVLSASVNSNLINIYGNHNGMLSEVNGTPRIDDLEKNAIKLVDGGDGTFDEGDYILFYGQDPDKWKLNSAGTSFFFEKNLYSDQSYFFIKVDDNSGAKRIAAISSLISSGTNVASFNDFKVKEDERINLMQLKNKGGSGKLWIGDVFEINLSGNYNFSFPNIDPTSPVNADVSVLANTPFPTSSSFSFISGANTSTISIPGLNQGVHNSVALRRNGSLSFTPTSSTVSFNLTYNKPLGVNGVGYLDYIEVNARRLLTMAGDQMEFRDLNSVGVGNRAKYNLNLANGVAEIWDVTNPIEIGSVTYNKTSSTIDFTLSADSLRTFIAFKDTGFFEPIFVGKVNNQNIHGEAVPDMLMVYHPLFINQVDELKQFHESNGLRVLKASVEEIYNEFSGGMQDVSAIKTFAKMFYDRGGSKPPRFLLLFGDGSYDYKNRVKPNHNFVPVWESANSLADVSSYTTDDFYALLDDGESMGDNELMDIAVGRLTVTNPSQAQTMVNKIINYQKQGTAISQIANCNDLNSGSPYGDWRNKICFVTDDMDENWEAGFFYHTERVMDSIKKNHSTFNIQKVHMDAYKQTSVSGGERYYDGAEAFRRIVENGVLIATYEGHGGEIGWGTERFLDVPTINGWTNANRLSVFLTATCEFAKYDDPSRTSAGELCVLNPKGAAVALFTTTRPVYQFSNEQLITAFFEEVFVKNADGSSRTMGEIYMETKNNSGVIGDNNSRRFGLIGDPALNLAFPKHSIVTTEINNKPVSSVTDTLKALSKITVKGYVADALGTVLTNYNGVVFPTVYDKPTQLSTLGNRSPSDIFPFEIQNSILHKGKATVKNGWFEFTFLVPKDINYQFGKGKISYYCYDGKEDGTGYFLDAVVGGTDLTASLDKDGPEVGLYMNDKNFVSGGITDETPSIYAEIFDSNGINTTGNGIGHDLTAILDEKTSNPIVLNDYYQSDLDSYQSGKVSYPMSKLADGNHTLSFKAWDVHNNSSDKSIDFVVVKNEQLAIEHVLNYPNPFTTRTQFFFEHNQSCEFLEVQIQVFTVSGKLVKSINQLVKTHGFRVDAIEWDGRDDYGDKIGRGTYVYKVKVVDDKGNKVEKYEKLVLLK